MTERIEAPFTPDQVLALNRFQTSGVMHPFTCGVRDEHPDDPGILVAVAHGWLCPHAPCDYEQTWAHGFMADPVEVAAMITSLDRFTRAAPAPEGRTPVEEALSELQIAVSRPVGVAMNLEETERAQRAYLTLHAALDRAGSPQGGQ